MWLVALCRAAPFRQQVASEPAASFLPSQWNLPKARAPSLSRGPRFPPFPQSAQALRTPLAAASALGEGTHPPCCQDTIIFSPLNSASQQHLAPLDHAVFLAFTTHLLGFSPPFVIPQKVGSEAPGISPSMLCLLCWKNMALNQRHMLEIPRFLSPTLASLLNPRLIHISNCLTDMPLGISSSAWPK